MHAYIETELSSLARHLQNVAGSIKDTLDSGEGSIHDPCFAYPEGTFNALYAQAESLEATADLLLASIPDPEA